MKSINIDDNYTDICELIYQSVFNHLHSRVNFKVVKKGRIITGGPSLFIILSQENISYMCHQSCVLADKKIF